MQMEKKQDKEVTLTGDFIPIAADKKGNRQGQRFLMAKTGESDSYKMAVG